MSREESTLAVNLAITQASRGKDVLLIDGDEQGTARAFTQLQRMFSANLDIQRSLYMELKSERKFDCRAPSIEQIFVGHVRRGPNPAFLFIAEVEQDSRNRLFSV